MIEIKFGDELSVSFESMRFEYIVSNGHLYNKSRGKNAAIITAAFPSYDKYKIASEAYGFIVDNGDWPNSRGSEQFASISDVSKLLDRCLVALSSRPLFRVLHNNRDITDNYIKSIKKTMETTPTSVMEKFKTALLPEPEKTFRKLGITNGDNILTTEGTQLFLNWLFQGNKEKFNEEIVSKLVEEEKKK